MEPDKAQDIVTIKFQEVPLAEVLDTYAEYLGKTILRAPNLALTTPITLKVQGEITLKEAIEALDTVLALNGVTMVPMGTKFMKAVPFAQAQQEAAAFSTVTCHRRMATTAAGPLFARKRACYTDVAHSTRRIES